MDGRPLGVEGVEARVFGLEDYVASGFEAKPDEVGDKLLLRVNEHRVPAVKVAVRDAVTLPLDPELGAAVDHTFSQHAFAEAVAA